ncbi:MAG: helix-turn-helix domain-containing protein [Fibrobacterota bacterium]|nr:AraC family transcriptional regulator [Chitinispirillaceae bacterium]
MLTKILLSIFLLPLCIYGVLLLPSENKAIYLAGVDADVMWGNNTLPTDVPLWITFDDNHEGGTSKHIACSVSDSVQWIYCKKPGCPWPYAGLSLVLPGDTVSHHQYSYKKDDSLVMVLRSNHESTVKLQLATYDPSVTKPDDDRSYRVLEHYITVKKENHRVAVPLGEFKTAAWWMQRYKVPPENNDLHLEAIWRIEWEFTGPDRLGKIDTLIISRVELKHHTSKSAYILGIVAITMLTGIGVRRKITKRKKIAAATVDSDIPLQPLQPRPVVTEAGEWERVLSYLQNNYFDAELNLQKVAAELGFSESRLSRLINEHNPDGFRSLIHDLRIVEAKRLLSETTLNISEIAFKLGYAASSHFNREFKQRAGSTPSGFRKESVGA